MARVSEACGVAEFRDGRHHAVELPDLLESLHLQPGVGEQAADAALRIEVHLAAAERQPDPAHGRAPRVQPRKRENDAIARDLAHRAQQRQRVRDVVEESDPERHVEGDVRTQLQQLAAHEVAPRPEPFPIRRRATQVEHRVRDVQAGDPRRAASRQLQAVDPAPAPDVEERPSGHRLRRVHRELEPLVHVAPEDAVEETGQARLVAGVDLLKRLRLVVPVLRLPDEGIAHSPSTSRMVVNRKSRSSRSSFRSVRASP